MAKGMAAVQPGGLGASVAEAVAPLIEARGLRKAYGPRLVLDGVSLSAQAGEVVGLLGPNGAGKTTTLGILATMLRPDSGSIRIAGLDARVATAAVRRQLGFVPQSIALYPSLSAARNLELFARLHGLDRRAARQRTRLMLEEVGLAERAGDAVATLSGGMQRRLNLACGIVHRPRVLLLDEPTVGIDPQSREKILATVRNLAAVDRVAVIYSTHYMEEVERLCDRVQLIDDGRVVAAGTVAEVIALSGGQPRIAITFRQPPPPAWSAGLPVAPLAVTDPSGDAALVSPDAPTRITLALTSLADTGKVLERATAAGGEVIEFTVHAPNLSDAFIALTGHALRAGAPPAP